MEAIGQLTGGVAHDFNNLLMVGARQPGAAAESGCPTTQKRMSLVDNAMQAAQRGASLTQRMLAFARRQELDPEAGRPARPGPRHESICCAVRSDRRS